MAKLTVKIMEPNVMQIKKGIRLSFADKLGVVGKVCKN